MIPRCFPILPLATIAGLVAGTGQATAALIAYEPFDYTTVGDSLQGKGGAETGFTGTWDDSFKNTEMFLKAGSLNFSDLPTTGNHIGYLSNSNQDVFHRNLDPTAISTLTSSGSIYFSIDRHHRRQCR